MIKTDHLAVRGLHTEANPYSACPDGSLKVADNVVVERAGVVEPRPGFEFDHTVLTTVGAPLRLLPWNGDVLRVNEDDSSSWTSDPDEPIDPEIPWTPHRMRAAEMNGNLYLSTADGVRRFSAAGATVAPKAGIAGFAVLGVVSQTGSAGFLQNGNYVAYRVLVSRRDANGNIIRSASVGSAYAKNGSGITRELQVTAYFKYGSSFDGDFLFEGTGADDVLELYRTKQSAAVPGNEYFLVASHALTSVELAAGSYTFTDNTADVDLGAPLYTNDSRESVQGANYRPPMGRELAVFKGSLFVGNTLGPKRITLKMSDGGDRSGQTTGIGVRLITARRTNGSANLNITVPLGSTAELKPGMMLSDATSWSGSNPVVITAVNAVSGAGAVTLSSTWGGASDGAGVTLILWDTVWIGNFVYPMSSPSIFLQALNAGMATPRVPSSAIYTAFCPAGYAYNLLGTSPQQLNNVTIVVEEAARGRTTQDFVTATHGNEYFPKLEEPGVTTTVETEADDQPHVLQCSKPGEPEHFPPDLRYRYKIGRKTEDLLRAVPTRDAMWVFKTDGLWRVSGIAAPNFRVDPFDPTLRLLMPDAVCVLDDVVYAWTNRGVVAVTSAGVVPLSGPIQAQLDNQQRLYGGDDASWTYAVWMCADPVRSNVFVGVAALGDEVPEQTGAIYCFNTRTMEWTTWTPPESRSIHMAHDGERLLIANKQSNTVYAQRVSTDAGALMNDEVPIYADGSYRIDVVDDDHSDNGDGTGTISFAPDDVRDWSPSVGDAIYQAGEVYSVLEVNGPEVTFSPPGIALGTAYAYASYESVVTWNPKGMPTTVQRWREALVSFDDCRGLSRVGVTFETPVSSATATRRLPGASLSTQETKTTARVMVPRGAARAPTLCPGFSLRQALAPWRVSGIGLVYEEIGVRVQR